MCVPVQHSTGSWADTPEPRWAPSRASSPRAGSGLVLPRSRQGGRAKLGENWGYLFEIRLFRHQAGIMIP